MSQPSSLPKVKIEKLVKVCLQKNCNSKLFAKLCRQLQDSCKITSTDAGDGLFSDSILGYVNTSPLFLDYIYQLAFDSISLFPISKLILYFATHKVRSQNAVIIYLAKDIDKWGPSEETCHDFVNSLMVYLSKMSSNAKDIMRDEKQLPRLRKDLNAIGYLLLRLNQTGQRKYLFESDNSSQNKKLQSILLNFLSVVNKMDPEFKSRLQESFGSTLSRETTGDLGVNTNSQQRPSLKVSDTPVLKLSRVFRLTWLESLMLTSSRLIQGDEFIQQLGALLTDEPSNVVIEDLVTTAFDCFAVSLLRKDSPKYFSLWRSFIVKRLPLVIKKIAKDFAILDGIICQPIMSLDRGTINLLRISDGGDALDEMFSSFPSTTRDVREEFLRACIDIDLITPDSLSKTLRETASAQATHNENSVKVVGPEFIVERDGHKILIDDLFQLAADENPEYVAFEESRIVWIVEKFEDLDGIRQERITKSLPEFLSKCIAVRNLRLLGRFCQALGLNLSGLDALVLHMQPSKLLSPLVLFLESWNGDEEGTDMQQESADFGTIALTVLIIFRRYGLSIADLENGSQSSISQWNIIKLLLSRDYLQYSLGDLTDDQKDLIGAWITALYDTGGISDDLMNQARFVDFVTLVPVLFQQSILACERGIMDYEMLSGGLEYFKQPFLIPTLVGAFEFIANYIWESQDISIVLRILHDLAGSFDSLQGDAKNLGLMVLTCVGEEVHDALLKCKFTRPDTPVDELLKILAPYAIPTSRYGTLDTESPNLEKTIKDNISILVGWIQSLDQGQMTGPPGYNTSSITMSMQQLGSKKVLNVMLEQLEETDQQGNSQNMVDVVSALILAVDREVQHIPGFANGSRLDMDLLGLVLNEPEESIIAMRQQVLQEKGTWHGLLLFQKLKQRIERLRHRFSLPKPDDTTDIFGESMDWKY